MRESGKKKIREGTSSEKIVRESRERKQWEKVTRKVMKEW